jgi:hypothetical protein
LQQTEPKDIVFNRKSLDGLQVQTLGRVGTTSETVGKVTRPGSRDDGLFYLYPGGGADADHRDEIQSMSD